MAEAPQKRLREESHNAETPDFEDSNSNTNAKRQKPYNNILSLLDEEEEQEEPSQDLSAMFTTLQQELSSSAAAFDFDSPALRAEDEAQHHQTTANTSADGCGEKADDSVKSVIRHLLEASDDELGIPNTENNNVDINYAAENFPLGFGENGLWELEDVAANYYAILQSELFM